jgi:hypothetical protein
MKTRTNEQPGKTVRHEYAPTGKRFRILAQKYGC